MIFIVVQVWLDLKMPDYMSKITELVQTKESGMKDILMGGKYGIITKNDISSIIDGLDNVLSDRCLYETLKKRESKMKRACGCDYKELRHTHKSV